MTNTAISNTAMTNTAKFLVPVIGQHVREDIIVLATRVYVFTANIPLNPIVG